MRSKMVLVASFLSSLFHPPESFTSPQLTSLVAQMLRSLPVMRETRVQSLGWEDPLEKEMAIHSSILT